jgi:RNA polymerase sigma-70 factor (ECF subfamily)
VIDLEVNIIVRIKSGDERPLYELYRLYRNEFISWCSKNFKANEEQAKDAFQEAILDFHQNIINEKLIELTSNLKTYLFQLGKFKLLNILKKEARITYNDFFEL